MRRVKKAPTVSPENLPLLKRSEIIDERGSCKLNPFMWQGNRLRIVGYCVDKGYSIKNETTGEYKWKRVNWVETILNIEVR